MATLIGKKPATSKTSTIPQASLGKILFMFAWPAAWYSILIYGIGRQLFPSAGTTPSWLFLSIIVLGTGTEMMVGLALLHREGYPFRLSALKNRIRWHWPKGWKAWVLAVVVFILGMGLSMAMGSLNKTLASTPGFIPPSFWPAASNPNIEINSIKDVFPDINITGNYLFVLLYFVIGLVFNVFGEEIYYRGYLLPRMHGVFGRWDWVANGVLFTLKHVYQRWLYPGLLAGGLGLAFVAGPLGSLPLAMVFHWIANYLLQMVMLIQAALGLG